jgi:hypothetical protein
MSSVGLWGFLKFCLITFSQGHVPNPDLAAVIHSLAHFVHDQQRYAGRDDAEGHDTHGLVAVC